MKDDPCSYDRNFCNCIKKPKKNSGLQRGLNPWPRDTGATLYQLSYEATDVGSRSILGSYIPVKDMKVNDAYEINHMWTADMKSNEGWSSQLWSQFLQLRKEAWKNSGLQPWTVNREPVTSRYRCCFFHSRHRRPWKNKNKKLEAVYNQWYSI